MTKISIENITLLIKLFPYCDRLGMTKLLSPKYKTNMTFYFQTFDNIL